MDLDSTAAGARTLAQNAAKSTLHALWTATAAHPRTATIAALVAIIVSGFIGFAIGRGA